MSHFSTDLPLNNSAQWKQLYEAALLEVDKGKMPDRITEARRAMHDRAEEILSSASLAEHRALHNALHCLQILEAVTTRERPAA
jgi:hypothetical protein